MTKQVDIPILKQRIELCYTYSHEPEKFNQEERDECLTQANTLHAHLVKLKATELKPELDFKVEGDAEKSQFVSQQLQSNQKLLNSHNNIIKELQALTALLGDLVKLATPTVPSLALSASHPLTNSPVEDLDLGFRKYYLISFDGAGNEHHEGGVQTSQQILDVLGNEPITDIFLFSHGWLGDIPAARNQYNKWLRAMSGQTADIERIKQLRPGFRPLLIGLHWPSLPWGDEELGSTVVSFDPTTVAPVERLVEQYAQRLADTEASRRALKTIFMAAMEDMAPAHMPPEVCVAYKILNGEAGLGSEGEAASPGADRASFDPQSIFQASEAEPVNFGGWSWGRLLAPLRTLSFWKMKDRACQVGESGGYKLLTQLQRAAAEGVRFHLIGHSFGCIVVSSMLAGPSGRGTLVRPVNSVALVQGALSFWSYCCDIPYLPGRAGYFYSLIADGKVAGPIVTTQSEFDTAVGKMYPLAAGIVLSEVDFAPGQLPEYGGLGTFGARGPGLKIVDMDMLPLDAEYQFEPGKIYNLESSKYICDVSGGDLAGGAHNDIAKPEVAHAVWSAAFGS